MANTINDLYLKYVNKVGKTLENDRYFRYLFEMVQAGNTTLQQTHQVLHKVVDERWLSVIEDSLDALTRITDKPRRYITTSEEVVPVALAKKITADSVRHLSMNTQFIASTEDGDIHPTRVLNVTTEETYDLYENRFIYYLIQRLVTFIDKRTDVIFWSTGDETSNVLKMHSQVDDAYEQIEYKLEMTVKNRQSFAENDSDNMQVFMRIDRVRRMVMALRNSAFCEIMAGCSRVTSPIQRTNLLMKNPDYRTCLKLWQFLESYDEVGYTIDAQDSVLEFDEEYLLQLYSNLITNYTVFKSLLEADPRKLDEIPPKRRRVIKPKFLKRIEEQIVDDYDIPDVEIRKVLIEEVTQAQLDAEARLEEEIALRKAAEEAAADTEQALKEYRWQAEFQQAEAARQAEDRLNFVKAQAENERQSLQAALDAAQEKAGAEIAQLQAALDARQAEMKASLTAARQEAAEKLSQAQNAAAAREAEMQAAIDAARQEAVEKLSPVQNAAAAREAEMQAAFDAARQEAAEKLSHVQNAAATREAEMQAALDAVRQEAAEKLSHVQNAAAAREAEMQAAFDAAQQEAAEKLSQAQAQQQAQKRALKEAIAERNNAINMQKKALKRANKEAKLRAAAEARADENKLSRRILDAIAPRRAERDSNQDQKGEE